MRIPSVKIIAAVDDNGLIGVGNKLPWNIKDELKHFKETTTGNIVVMGRSTYESIGRPLPNRTNIVFSKTSNQTDKEKDIWYCSDIFEFCILWHHCIDRKINTKTEEGILTLLPEKDIWVIGGSQLYKKFMDLNLVESLLITKVKGDFSPSDGDEDLIYFPYWKTSSFDKQFPYFDTKKTTREYDIIEYKSELGVKQWQ